MKDIEVLDRMKLNSLIALLFHNEVVIGMEKC